MTVHRAWRLVGFEKGKGFDLWRRGRGWRGILSVDVDRTRILPTTPLWSQAKGRMAVSDQLRVGFSGLGRNCREYAHQALGLFPVIGVIGGATATDGRVRGKTSGDGVSCHRSEALVGSVSERLYSKLCCPLRSAKPHCSRHPESQVARPNPRPG